MQRSCMVITFLPQRVWAAPSRWSGHALVAFGDRSRRWRLRPFGLRSLPRSEWKVRCFFHAIAPGSHPPLYHPPTVLGAVKDNGRADARP